MGQTPHITTVLRFESAAAGGEAPNDHAYACACGRDDVRRRAVIAVSWHPAPVADTGSIGLCGVHQEHPLKIGELGRPAGAIRSIGKFAPR